MKLEGHVRECDEFKLNIREHLQTNSREHGHINEHLDRIDDALGKVALKVAGIVGAASILVSLVMWLVKGQ